MNQAVLKQLRELERALARQDLTAARRRQLQSIVNVLCLRLAQSIGRAVA